MSYSFSLRAASIAALAAAASSQLDAVCETQPAHKVDREAALKNLQAHADLVGEPGEGQELIASMHGSISTRAGADPAVMEVVNAGSGCSVYRQNATSQA